ALLRDGCFSRRLSRVVLPLPRNPVTTTTGANRVKAVIPSALLDRPDRGKRRDVVPVERIDGPVGDLVERCPELRQLVAEAGLAAGAFDDVLAARPVAHGDGDRPQHGVDELDPMRPRQMTIMRVAPRPDPRGIGAGLGEMRSATQDATEPAQA